MNDIPEKRGYRIAWVTCSLMAVLLIVGGVTLAFTLSGVSASQNVETQGKRRDCVTSLSTARRSVFDDVDIYKAILINMSVQKALKGVQPDLTEVSRVAGRLDSALVEARRLQPSKTLDALIARGGMVAGVRYEACPT